MNMRKYRPAGAGVVHLCRLLVPLLSVLAPSVSAQCTGACNQYANSYWPMTVGNKWTMRNASTHSPVVFSIQQSPSTFACQTSPIRLRIDKIDPRDYWAPNFQANLSWYLGVRSNGDVIALGHNWSNFSGTPVYGTEFYRTDPAYNSTTYPPYILMRSNGPSAAAITVPLIYFGSGANPDYSCVAPPTSPSPGSWAVTWSSTVVSTPGYSGTAMLATYVETYSSLTEYWYFAQNIGPVKIINNDGITLELVDRVAGSGTASASSVTLRDIVIANAGTTAGLNFDQWNYYYTQATHSGPPSPEDVCMAPSNRTNLITIDQYLSTVSQRGSSCSTGVHWPMTELNQVTALAGTTSGLSYDQWNYYDTAAGYSVIDVPAACMSSVTYQDGQSAPGAPPTTMYPNRSALYTAAQWYALVQYRRQGGACQ